MNLFKIDSLKALLCALSFFYFHMVSAQTNFNSNGIHFPLLKNKKEATISAGYMFGANVSGLSFQSAYNIRNNLGIMLNFWNADKSTKYENYKYKTNRQLEFGIGTAQHTEKISMSIYGGYGFGKLSTNNLQINEYNVQFSRFFIQSAIIRVYDIVYFGTSLRINYMNFKNGDINVNYNNFTQVRELENHNPSIQPEIGGILGFKADNLFGDFTFTYFHRPVDELNFSRIVARFAIGYYLNKKGLNKIKKPK